MKYIFLVLWTFSLFLLMFSSFPSRVECRPTPLGPGPPPSSLSFNHHHQHARSPSMTSPLTSNSACPVLEGVGNPWPDLLATDISAKAWDSPIILEGTARSRSEVRPDGSFGVTFDLHRVVKGDAPLLRRRKQFRIQFLDSPTPPPVFVEKGRNKNRNFLRNTVSNSSSSLVRVSGSSNSNMEVKSLSRSSSVLRNSNTPGGRSMSNSISTSPIQSGHQNQRQLQLYHQTQQQQSARNYQQAQLQRTLAQRRSQNGQGGQVLSSASRVYRNSTISASGTLRRGGRSLPQSSKCLPPKAVIKTGRKYYVFAAKVGNHFIAVFSPELANKRNNKAVEGAICKGCGQAPSLVVVKDVLQVRERLRLRCRLRAGNPIPILTWWKDGRPLNLTDPRLRLRTKRRQSVLVIRRTRESDAGIYRCEAKNPLGSAYASVKVAVDSGSSSSLDRRPPSGQGSKVVNKSKTATESSSPKRPPQPNRPSSRPVETTPTTLWPLEGRECPFDSYCLNGGTCSYFETIGEFVCQCAEGYKGQRCDTKDISSSGNPGGDYESTRRLLMLWE